MGGAREFSAFAPQKNTTALCRMAKTFMILAVARLTGDCEVTKAHYNKVGKITVQAGKVRS